MATRGIIKLTFLLSIAKKNSPAFIYCGLFTATQPGLTDHRCYDHEFVLAPHIDYDHAAFLLVGVIIDGIRLHLAMNHGYRDRC